MLNIEDKMFNYDASKISLQMEKKLYNKDEFNRQTFPSIIYSFK